MMAFINTQLCLASGMFFFADFTQKDGFAIFAAMFILIAAMPVIFHVVIWGKK